MPSNKAQAVHIFKMVDNMTEFMNEALIICPSFNKKWKINKYKDYYNLHTKKKIKITSIFKELRLNNIINRLIYGFQVAFKLKNEKNLIVSRSLITSFFLILFKVQHFLEIHQELKGLTKLIFINLKFANSKYLTKVIFISKGLSNFYRLNSKKYLILHDGCDLRDFKNKRKIRKKIKNIYYMGSFYKGRGIEIIMNLSKLTPEFNYYLYGLRDEKIKSFRNFNVFPIVSYKKTLKIVNNADLLLMPYQSKVSINSKNFNDDISKFISPLKMFEYLATGIPIISSNLNVLREILSNKKNSILVKNYSDPVAWKKAINLLSNNFPLRKNISKNAYLTSIKNTWNIRSKRIYEVYKQNKNHLN